MKLETQMYLVVFEPQILVRFKSEVHTVADELSDYGQICAYIVLSGTYRLGATFKKRLI